MYSKLRDYNCRICKTRTSSYNTSVVFCWHCKARFAVEVDKDMLVRRNTQKNKTVCPINSCEEIFETRKALKQHKQEAHAL